MHARVPPRESVCSTLLRRLKCSTLAGLQRMDAARLGREHSVVDSDESCTAWLKTCVHDHDRDGPTASVQRHQRTTAVVVRTASLCTNLEAISCVRSTHYCRYQSIQSRVCL